MLAFILTAVTLLTSVLSGMAGVGGGTILIAVLYAVGLLPAVAVPLHAIVQMVANGTRVLAFLKHVDWHAMRWFLLGVVPSPFLVAPLIVDANPDIIRLVMAVFVVLSMWPRALSFIHLHGPVGMVIGGVMGGGVGMVVGASGLLVAPFFLRPGWDKQKTIATLAVGQTLAHLMKVVAFASYGFSVIGYWQWLVPMVLAAIAGTWIGKRLHGRLTEEQFQLTFRVILGLLAAKLAWDAAGGLGWF